MRLLALAAAPWWLPCQYEGSPVFQFFMSSWDSSRWIAFPWGRCLCENPWAGTRATARPLCWKEGHWAWSLGGVVAVGVSIAWSKKVPWSDSNPRPPASQPSTLTTTPSMLLETRFARSRLAARGGRRPTRGCDAPHPGPRSEGASDWRGLFKMPKCFWVASQAAWSAWGASLFGMSSDPVPSGRRGTAAVWAGSPSWASHAVGCFPSAPGRRGRGPLGGWKSSLPVCAVGVCPTPWGASHGSWAFSLFTFLLAEWGSDP